MAERLRIILCILGGGLGLGATGAVFGGVAGALAWANGKSSGGRLGLWARQALSRLAGRTFSRIASGAVIGAAEGASALLLLGALAGFWCGYTDRVELLLDLGLAALLLMIAAALCGALAYCLVWARGAAVYTIAGLCCGLFLGAVAESRLTIGDGAMLGTLTGGALGAVVTILVKLGRRS